MNYFFSIMPLLCKYGLIVYFLLFTAISSLAGQVTNDVKNSQDSPLLSRYDGSYIIGYEKKEYSDFPLLLSGPKAWDR
ncbi:MAG: hypothetical protein KKF12_09025 [Proteobacteria bacterium]|nr:hypothetical protein [Desulfobacula sp.]MBU3953578.1 hypothetical protein [Pseudomonadota bacterium]MBU4130949.1 hypothetical protein [Pseudomonadota bacterium]